MKIHAIQTGTATVKRRQAEGVGHGRLRLVWTLLDREWTGPQRIFAFAIEHPEGVIVVDTGETARPRRRSGHSSCGSGSLRPTCGGWS